MEKTLLINLMHVYKRPLQVIHYFLIPCTVRLTGPVTLSALHAGFGVQMGKERSSSSPVP